MSDQRSREPRLTEPDRIVEQLEQAIKEERAAHANVLAVVERGYQETYGAIVHRAEMCAHEWMTKYEAEHVALLALQQQIRQAFDEFGAELTRIAKINTEEDWPRTVPELTVYIWLKKARHALLPDPGEADAPPEPVREKSG